MARSDEGERAAKVHAVWSASNGSPPEMGGGGGGPPLPWSEVTQRAVGLIHAVENGRTFTAEALSDPWRWHAFRAFLALRPMCRVLMWIYMASFLFETPSWCWMRDDGCGDINVIPRSALSGYLGMDVLRRMHAAIVLIFLAEESAACYSLGAWMFWRRLSIAASSFALLDNLVGMWNGYGLPPQDIYWSPALRPFVFMTRSLDVQGFISIALPAALSTHVMDLVAMQLVLLLVWAWCGLLLFGHSDEGTAFFSTFEHACGSLFTAFTTANFPDVMMPAYSQNRFVFLYFFIFLVLSLYLIFNAMLAALFTAYKTRKALIRQEEEATIEDSLTRIFGMLAETGGEDQKPCLTWEAWHSFWTCYCRESSEWSTSRAQAIFNYLLAPGSNVLFCDSWVKVGKMLAAPDVIVQRSEPRVVSLKWYRVLTVLSNVVDASVLASLITSMYQTDGFLRDEDYRWLVPGPAVYAHICCLSLYLVEMCLRAAVVGSSMFRKPTVLTDAVLGTSLLLLYAALFVADHRGADWAAHGGGGRRLLAILRLLQVERVLRRFRRLRKASNTLLMLLGSFKRVGSALFLTYFSFSTIGVETFGGLVRTDSKRLDDTQFAEQGKTEHFHGYFANNFNDFASGLVVLFELMVVNNWFVLAHGLAEIAPWSPRVGWAFCISFYFIVHTVLLNVLVTSVVERYEQISWKADEHHDELQDWVLCVPAAGTTIASMEDPGDDFKSQLAGPGKGDYGLLMDDDPDTKDKLDTLRNLLVTGTEGPGHASPGRADVSGAQA